MERSRVAANVRIGLLIGLVACLVFANALRNGFVWDDANLIVDNPAIKRVGQFPALFAPRWFQDDLVKPAYRPLAYMSFAFDYHRWRLNPVGYHATNLALHVASALLLYGVLMRLLDRRVAAVVAALLFAVSPLRVEAVTYVKSRDEMLACILMLAGLLLFDRSRQAREEGRMASAWVGWGMSMACFALLPFAKEHGLVFPLLLTAWVLSSYGAGRRKEALMHTVPAWLLMIGHLVFRAMVVRPAGVSELANIQVAGDSVGQAVLTTLWFYVRCLVFPVGLNADPDFETASSLGGGAGVGITVSLLVVIAGIAWMRADRIVVLGAAWLVIALLPASNVFLISTRALAEERLYLPSVGFWIMAGRCAERSLRGRNATGGLTVLGLLLFTYSAGSVQRNPVWQNDFSLWRDTVRKSPQMTRPQFHLGLAYADLGRTGQALRRYEEALRLSVGYLEARNSLGVAYLSVNDLAKAREQFEKVLEGDPLQPRALNNLGAVWLASGPEKRGEAERCFRQAVALRPQFAEARYNLARIFAEDGRDAEARAEYERVIMVNPDFAKAYNGLGLLVEKGGRLAEAERLYQRAAELDSTSVEPLNNLGFLYLRQNREQEAAEVFADVLARKPDYEVAHFQLGRICERVGDVAGAFKHYQAAVKLKPDYYQAQTNLGIILRSLGKRAEAVDAFRSALKSAPSEWQPHCMLGVTLSELGHLAEAAEELRRALKLNPSSALVSSHLASVEKLLAGGNGLKHEK